MTTLSGAVRPILPGFHPDPTVCRVGDDYYLATSSFEYFPGVPVFHSTDLMSWTQIGHVLTRRSQFEEGAGGPSGGIYAGTLRHHAGRFYYATTNINVHGRGQMILQSEDPAGPWSDPVYVPGAIGIDPDLAWDDEGRCLLTWHVLDFERGGQAIRQAQVDVDSGELLTPAVDVWQGSGLPAAEGPHLYHIGPWWYLMLAEGGTERGHCATIARSPSPDGPYEPHPSNPIFTHRSTVEPVQNVGHADLVQTPDGEWAAVYLGVRPAGSTPGFHALGRETFLAGIGWLGEWPVFIQERFEIPRTPSAFHDDFTAGMLDHRWVVPHGDPSVVEPREGGGITLSEGGLLCCRVQDLRWTADAAMAGDGTFGLRIDPRHGYHLELSGDQARAVACIGDVTTTVAAVPVSAADVTLRIQAVDPGTLPVPLGHAGPDDIVLSVVADCEATELARLDGRYLCTEVASGFTGRMLALGSETTATAVRSVTYTTP